MKQYGLIGKTLSHSFSKQYFDCYFKDKTCYSYDLYELDTIDQLPYLIQSRQPLGFNVTIPYKQAIIPYLDEITPEAKAIGAVNVVGIDYESVCDRPILKGYNTDVYGFEMSLIPHLKPHHTSAIILGTGGASRAVAFVLDKLGVDYVFVSRGKTGDRIINYTNLLPEIISLHTLIINTTPVGMYPNVEDCPFIYFEGITSQHLCYDLVYNPTKTIFLKEAETRGATVINGMDMLINQAMKSWEIWGIDMS